MQIQLLCGCGTTYETNIEPAEDRMPGTISCPLCRADGTAAANEYIRSTLESAPAASGLHLAHSPASEAAPGPGYEVTGLLDRTTFFVKEHTGLLKLTDTYDLLDPETGEPVGIAKEEPPAWAKWLRLLVKKQLMPTRVNIYETEGAPPVLSIVRGVVIFRSKVLVIAGDGTSLGYFKSKIFSLGGGFHVYDNSDQKVAEVKGDWKGWNFKFLNTQGSELGTVTKKWAGLGKELFTSADNYMISLNGDGSNRAVAALLLAAGIAIDTVFKESGGGLNIDLGD